MTFGNASVLDPQEQVFAIKPSGVSYGDLSPDKMVVLDLDGQLVDGELRPSSDTETHRCMFQSFAKSGVQAIAHTHSRNAVAFAQAARSIPCLGTTHSDFFNGPVPVTRVMTKSEVVDNYELNTGKVIVETFGNLDPSQVPCVLVCGHGPFAWGANAKKAVENAFALELVADMALKTLSLNPRAGSVPDYLLEKHFFRKHGVGAYYGQKKP